MSGFQLTSETFFRTASRRYGFAVVTVAAAFAFRMALVPWLGYEAPFLLFMLAIMAAAQSGGRGAGLLATSLATLCAWFFLLPYHFSFRLESTADFLNLTLFACTGGGISIMCERLRHAATVANRKERTTMAMLDSASQGIIGVTKDGRIAIVNTMTERLFGYLRSELIGQPLKLLAPEGWRGDRSHSDSSHGDPLNPADPGTELSGRRKDTSEFPAEVSISSVETENGRLSVAFVTDISQRQLAEEILRQQAELLDLAQDPIFTWDLAGRIHDWNRGARTLYGFSANEAIGTVSHQLLRSKLPLPLTEFETRLAVDGEWIGEVARTTKDNRLVVVESRMVVYRGPRGVPMVLESDRDITERWRASEEIVRLTESLEQRVQERTAQFEAANKELEAFAYSVSHDLRAPLRGIDGWSLAFLEDYGDQVDERGRAFLNRVRSETQRLGHLIDDLLQLSRVARQQLDKQSVDISKLASQIGARLKELDPGRNIRLVVQPELTAAGDPRLLEVVLANLLENAVKFTGGRPDALIEFGQSIISGEKVFYVRDNGVGFDMAYSSKLFGVFQRLHKSSEFPGTGIGLATVQRIIHRHGGSVHAESALGQGSTFYFALPL